MEQQRVKNKRLGKGAYQHDVRTLRLVEFALPDLRVPENFDFDKRRASFPNHVWGNDAYGDCVIAGRANNLIRLERVEQRRTLDLKDEDAIDCYKRLTGCKRPGDANDTGLVVLEAMRDWRNNGWALRERNYKIAAYGEVEPTNRVQLRMAIYIFHGIHLGLWLPVAAQRMGNKWDYQGGSGQEWQPGSWGGHLVYAKKFGPEGLYVMTWGEEVLLTNSFVEKYCDEAWAVVDDLDNWRSKQTIDVSALEAQLAQISGHVNT